MRYAAIRNMDVSNGSGIGVALFTQGCLLHCKNCFNPNTWDLNKGNEFTDTIKEQFLNLVSRDYITRVSYLGGEPLLVSNSAYEIYKLSKYIKETYPNKTQWLYTGYIWEDIVNSELFDYIKYLDILVDGPYIDEQRDYTLLFRGSKNQRIIDVQKSLKSNQVVLCEKFYKGDK